jgi:hypothetical protein
MSQAANRELCSEVYAAEMKVRQASYYNTNLIQALNEARARLSVSKGRLERRRDDLGKLPMLLRQVESAKAEVQADLRIRKEAYELAIQALRKRQVMEMDALYAVLPIRVSGVKTNTRRPMQVCFC